MKPRASQRIFIDGPSGALEAVVEEPDAPAATGGAMVCHPHPLFGGTMENKVVTSIARALRDRGSPTLRFNFRGVGQSAGKFDGGEGETADAAAAAGWCEQRWPGRPLVVAGFSFGAYVAWRLARERTLDRLILVAPPVQRFDFSGERSPACPWLVVQGDDDEVVDNQSVMAWVEQFDPQPKVIRMSGVGHFFHGRLLELRESIGEALRSH
jgi:alpha/beta superfamily hydrolase